MRIGRGSHLLPDYARCACKYVDKLPVETVDEDVLLQEAVRKASEADVVVLALGESIYQSGEEAVPARILHCQSRNPSCFTKSSQLNKKLVVIVYSGRPLILTEVAAQADALIQAWYPGTMGGEALADLLYGTAGPVREAGDDISSQRWPNSGLLQRA